MNPSSQIKKTDILVGLDIGTTKICVIVAKKVGDKKIEILAKGQVVSRGVEKGEVKNILLASEDIREAVRLAEQKCGFKIKKVFVGIAGAHIKSSVMRLGITRAVNEVDTLINKNDISKLEIQAKNLQVNPGEVIISCQPQEFFVDGVSPRNNNPIGMRGNRLEANWHIIIGNTNPSKNIEMAVEMAGLEILTMDLEPLASAESVLTEEALNEGVCLIDIGGGTTDLAIFYGGVIRHTAIFPFAGEYITAFIRDKLKLTERTSTLLKENRSYTSALYKHIQENKILSIKNITGLPPVEIEQRKYCHLINSCLEQIFSLVKNEIQSTYFKNQLNAGIFITGGGANIPDLQKFVEQYLGIPTQIGRPIHYVSNNQDVTLHDTRYATAVGLVLLAAKSANETMIEVEIEAPIKIEVSAPIIKQEVTKLENAEVKKPYNWANNLKEKIKKSMFLDTDYYNEFEQD